MNKIMISTFISLFASVSLCAMPLKSEAEPPAEILFPGTERQYAKVDFQFTRPATGSLWLSIKDEDGNLLHEERFIQGPVARRYLFDLAMLESRVIVFQIYSDYGILLQTQKFRDLK